MTPELGYKNKVLLRTITGFSYFALLQPLLFAHYFYSGCSQVTLTTLLTFFTTTSRKRQFLSILIALNYLVVFSVVRRL